mmetsp:Transcript_764/g.1823  ORF Transcript_764/g.1823 Transcript_764/m.1823 type:complete len:106 (+) Transcript_764:1382-1699(+)
MGHLRILLHAYALHLSERSTTLRIAGCSHEQRAGELVRVYPCKGKGTPIVDPLARAILQICEGCPRSGSKEPPESEAQASPRRGRGDGVQVLVFFTERVSCFEFD